MAIIKHKPIPILTAKQIANFWSHVDCRAPDDCWEWKGCRFSAGYGRVTFAAQNFLASRLAYYIQHGEDPGEFKVCHKCDNPPCCNGKHLFLGTSGDNVRDAVKKGRWTFVAKNFPYACGEDIANSVLTDSTVRTIRREYLEDGNLRILGERHGVHLSTIWKIVKRKAWRHVE